MKLVNPTDDQLNTAFAEKVAGYFSNPAFKPQHSWCRKSPTGEIVVLDGLGALPPFTRSMDAVLPWLEKCAAWRRDADGEVFVYRHSAAGSASAGGKKETMCFPCSCVIALLRAHGVEVEFTK